MSVRRARSINEHSASRGQSDRLPTEGYPTPPADGLPKNDQANNVVLMTAGISLEEFDFKVAQLHERCKLAGLMYFNKRRGTKVVEVAGEAGLDLKFRSIKSGREYSLDQKLGTGNTGDVYRVLDNVGDYHAIKVVRFSLSLASTMKSINRLITEISFHVFLNKSDGVNESRVPRFSELVFPSSDAHPYIGIIMPLHGPSLSKILNTHRGYALSIMSIRKLARVLVSSLATLHRLGITHADLKPGNILIGNHPRNDPKLIACNDPRRQIFTSPEYVNHLHAWNSLGKQTDDFVFNGQGKHVIHLGNRFETNLIDFGASVYTNQHMIKQRICGSFHLKPPSDHYGLTQPTRVNTRDIWALGLLLFHLWTGHPYQPHKNHVNLLPYMERLVGDDGFLRMRCIEAIRDDTLFNSSTATDVKRFIERHPKDEPMDGIIMHLSHYFTVNGVIPRNEGTSMRGSRRLTSYLFDLIQQCLRLNEELRPTVIELLEHPFIKASGNHH